MTVDLNDRPEGMAAPANPDDPFLVVENLTVKFPTHDGLVQAVRFFNNPDRFPVEFPRRASN